MKKTWPEILNWELRGLEKLIVLGTGNALKADDAAGLLVASILDHHLSRYQKSKIKVFRAYEIIDQYLKKIKRLKPTHLIIVDALDFKSQPGSIMVTRIDLNQKRRKKIGGEFYDFLAQLRAESACKLMFIGIQPQSLDFGHPVTPAIKEACRQVANFLNQLLPRKTG
ncbi:MAG: hydrogenase maturation protease [Candidatus Saccharicenans sp.]